jgi:copper chaperone CopZ
MKKITFQTPMLFADHHVVEVRNIISAVAGVNDVYASSGFRMIEIEFDESQITPEKLQSALEASGYSSELVLPVEIGVSNEEDDNPKPYFRTTAEYVTAKATIGFSQKVKSQSGPPIWPVPGMEPIKIALEKE